MYLVFWGSQWGTASPAGSTNFSNDASGVAPRLQALFTGVGTNNETWSGVMTQYCEGVATGATSCPASAAHVGYPTGGALAGIWDDTGSAAPASATGHQIGVVAVAAASHFGNTTAASNRNAQYVIVSPSGTTPDGFNTPNGQFCAWHDYNGDTTLTGGAVASSVGDVAFTNMPYVPDAGSGCGAGFVNAGSSLDGVTIVEGHEYAETITDQNPAGGWTDSTGAENGDKCAWLTPGTAGGSQNVAFSTGSFAMQSTWSNDSASCLISHPIVGGGTGGTNDFSISAPPASATVTAGNAATTTITTATISGSAQSVALTASGVPSGATASFSPTSVTSGASSTLTVSTGVSTPTGSYAITVTGTGSASHSTSFSLTVTSGSTGGSTLSNGVPITGIAGAQGSQQTWTLAVPAAQDSLVFTISGGTGDADMYVRRGAAPTTTTYDCRPYVAGNNETCTFSAPTAGTYYVMLRGYAAYSGVTLKGTHSATGVAALANGVPVTGISGAAGSQKYWRLTVPAGKAKVVIGISGGTGDADLYTRIGAKPTTSTYSCRPYLTGNNETCTVTAPAAGDYYVMLRGYAAYSGVTLKGTYS